MISDALANRWRGWWWTAGIALLLCVAYAPALTRGPYGINDDYQYLYRVCHGTFDPAHNEQTGMGRPVAAWGLNAAYFFCGGQVAKLVWLRGFALLGVGVFVWTLCRALAAAGCSLNVAAAIAGLVGLSPACGVYAAWAAGLFSPYALAGALLAGRWMMDRRGLRPAAGVLLLVGVCATWQAAAPLALFPALVRAWTRPDATGGAFAGECARRWQPWLACAGAIIAYALLCRLAAWLGWMPAAGSDRLALTNDPPAKLRLLGDVLRSGATSWARLQSARLQWTVGISTGVLCLAALFLGRENGAGWRMVRRRTALALAMLVLGAAPLLLARENNAAFRALPIIYLAITFLGVQGLRALVCAKGIWMGLPVLALLAVSAGSARYHVWHGLVEPNLREYAGLREQARRQFAPTPPEKLVYLLPPPTLLAAPWLTPSWEYGLVSSSFWWVTRPFLLLIFEEISPESAGPMRLTVAYREAGNPGVPVLDPLPVLLREAGVWQDDPRWGKVRVFRNGWLYSPWFGYLNAQGLPVIQHHLLGSLLLISQGQDGNALWFFRREPGQFYTSREAFPSLFLVRSHHWTYLSDDCPEFARLYDYADKTSAPLIAPD